MHPMRSLVYFASAYEPDGFQCCSKIRSPQRHGSMRLVYYQCTTAPLSCSEVTATGGSCGTLSSLTISGTRLASASRAESAVTSKKMAHFARPHTALHAPWNADAPYTTHRGGGVKATPRMWGKKGD